MNKALLLALLLAASFSATAQAPQQFNYQGIARNASGNPLASANIGLRLTIHNGSATGAVVYQETFTVTTNAYGLYNVAVGTGTVVSGAFNTIAWNVLTKYMQVEIDPAGGTSYTDLGATQLLSVPYALSALNGITGPGLTNYIPKFTSPSALGNSGFYQQTTTNKIGLGTTSPNATLNIVSGTDSIVHFVRGNATPTVYGVSRLEYGGSADASRVEMLSTSIRTTADSMGIGVEGAGSQVGTLGYGASSTANQTSGVEGDAYASRTWSIGLLGAANLMGSTSPTYSVGVYGMASGGIVNYAGYFIGNVNVAGTLSKLGGTFKIDHPLDPAHKYLYHSFVESPDMLNIYNGNITTDATGTATVTLPSYFEALNQDFRYQLTVIGTFAQAIISKEISGNAFEIKTSVPNVKVSWQVTGVRHDVWANANRIVPEVEKEPFNQGKYMSAKEYDMPRDLQIGADVKPTLKDNSNALPVKE